VVAVAVVNEVLERFRHFRDCGRFPFEFRELLYLDAVMGRRLTSSQLSSCPSE
jgi:hypothetical protein